MALTLYDSAPHEVYPSWELQLPALAPRSRLYQIEPLGIGTPATECFTSYLARLAHSHSLHVGNLLMDYVLPYLRSTGNDSTRQSRYFALSRMKTALSADVLTQDLVQALGALTFNPQLRWTTLLGWGEVCSQSKWLHPFQRWCEQCYAEEGESTYDRLLWQISAVRVCARHECWLTDCCAHCHQRLRIIRHRYLPGVCANCGAWLGALSVQAEITPSTPCPAEWDYELWSAEQIGALIAAVPSLTIPPTKETVSASIKHCCDLWLEGNGRSLAHWLGGSNTRGPRWYRGRVLPPLPMLVKLSYLTCIPLLQLMTDAASVAEHLRQHQLTVKSAPRLPIRPPLRATLPGFQQLEAQMTAATQEFPPPSMKEMARRLGYKHASSLQTKFPALSHQISLNYRAYQKEQAAPPAETPPRLDLTAQRKLLRQALRQPCPEPLSILAVKMGYAYSSIDFLTRKSPALCQAILEKRQQYHQAQMAARIQHCRTVITTAIKEDPPPPLETVAQRAGHGSPFFRQYLVDECCQLAVRHAQVRAERLQKISVRSEQSLKESPPRSVPQLAAELDVGTSIIRNNFPALCQLIIARHRAYLQDCLAVRRQRQLTPLLEASTGTSELEA
jgi:hypothetical protein